MQSIGCIGTLSATAGDGTSVGEFHPQTVEAETKKHTSNNFTKPLRYDTLVTYEYATNVSYHNSHTYLSSFQNICAQLWISYKIQYGHRHCTMETAVVMETIDQLSTYIHVYVDNYKNNIYVEEIMILFLYRIEFLPIYSKNSICSWRVSLYGNIT